MRHQGTVKFTTGQAWTEGTFKTAQAENAVSPGTQPTQTATQAEGSMAPGDIVAHFLPAANCLLRA